MTETNASYVVDVAKQVITTEKANPSYFSPVELIPASSIKPKPIQWLIPGLIPKGMTTMLAGESGIGKTYLALLIAAMVSNQGETFDGQPIDFGKVVIWSGEDTPEYTLIPRLRALGADMDNIDIIGTRVYEYSEKHQSGIIRHFDITTDLPLVEQTIQNWSGKETPIALLIIDPVMAAVLGDPHKASHVRQSLDPLRVLAESQNVAVIGVTHFSKGSGNNAPQDRVIGSQAFVAFARMVLGLAKDEQTGLRRLVILKSNITNTNVGYDFSYTFQKDSDGCEVARIELVEKLTGNARELLAEIEPEEPETGAMGDAIEFLKGILHEAPLPAKQVRADADGAGYSWRTIRRAADRLNIQKRKDKGIKGTWKWSLPDE